VIPRLSFPIRFSIFNTTSPAFLSSLSTIKFTFLNAGHVPGSAMILLEAEGKRVLYTGDIKLQTTKLIKGINYDLKDIDIMIKDNIDRNKIVTPHGWSRIKTHLGGLRFKKGKEEIDIWSLEGEPMFWDGKEYALQKYLEGVPLTIQSLAYDVDKKIAYGEVGFKALLNKKIEINSLGALYQGSSNRGQTMRKYAILRALRINASGLDFKLDFSNVKEKRKEYFRKEGR